MQSVILKINYFSTVKEFVSLKHNKPKYSSVGDFNGQIAIENFDIVLGIFVCCEVYVYRHPFAMHNLILKKLYGQKGKLSVTNI